MEVKTESSVFKSRDFGNEELGLCKGPTVDRRLVRRQWRRWRGWHQGRPEGWSHRFCRLRQRSAREGEDVKRKGGKGGKEEVRIGEGRRRRKQRGGKGGEERELGREEGKDRRREEQTWKYRGKWGQAEGVARQCSSP